MPLPRCSNKPQELDEAYHNQRLLEVEDRKDPLLILFLHDLKQYLLD